MFILLVGMFTGGGEAAPLANKVVRIIDGAVPVSGGAVPRAGGAAAVSCGADYILPS